MKHNSLKEGPFYAVKCLCHVQLDGHRVMLVVVAFHGMEELKNDNDVICDKSTGDESRLAVRDNAREDPLEPICNDFGDKFVDNVAQANRAEVSHGSGFGFFWYEDRKNVIHTRRDGVTVQDIKNSIGDVISHHTPKFLIE